MAASEEQNVLTISKLLRLIYKESTSSKTNFIKEIQLPKIQKLLDVSTNKIAENRNATNHFCIQNSQDSINRAGVFDEKISTSIK